MKRRLQCLITGGIRCMSSRQAKCLFLILFFFFSAKAKSPEFKFLVIPESHPIDAYERLVKAVVQVESSGDTLAYNVEENAVGAFQIRPIKVKDYNIRTGKDIKLSDCYNYNISREIFIYYAVRVGNHDFETIARNWNGSGESTKIYWEKVKARL